MSKETINRIHEMFPNTDPVIIASLLEETGDENAVIDRIVNNDPSTFFHGSQHKDNNHSRPRNTDQNRPKNKDRKPKREQKPKEEEKPSVTAPKKHKQQTFAQASNTTWGNIQVDTKGDIISAEELKKKQEEEEREKLEEQRRLAEAAKQKELEEKRRQEEQRRIEEEQRQQKEKEERERRRKEEEESRTKLFALPEIAEARVHINKFGSFAKY